ncbi:MAG: hypothetical protein ACPL7I_00725 [Myxococcota bacterium]
MEEEKREKKSHKEKEYRLILSISEIVLKKNFKVVESNREQTPYPSLLVRFSNGIVWRCVIFNDYDQAHMMEILHNSSEEIVLINYELIDADISKANYELTFRNRNGEIILRCRECISPSKLIQND